MATDPSAAASQRAVENLAAKLRRRSVSLRVHLFQSPKFTSPLHSQVVGSRETALETILVLRQVVSKARFSNIDQLVEIIRSVGRKLVDAQPKGMGGPLRACKSTIISPVRVHGREYRS